MCLISSFHSTVFTQWFNTSTRLGPPLKIFTQECDMVRRCDRVLGWHRSEIVTNQTKWKTSSAPPRRAAPSATCSLQPRYLLAFDIAFGGRQRVAAAPGILARTGGTTCDSPRHIWFSDLKFRSPHEIELYFSTRVGGIENPLKVRAEVDRPPHFPEYVGVRKTIWCSHAASVPRYIQNRCRE